MKRKAVYWETVEEDYCAGDKSLRAMGNEHGVSHVAVKKKADKEGWIRNPRARSKRVAGATQVNKTELVNLLVNQGQQRKRRVGAPSIKTPELLDAICGAISNGKSARAACDKVGISQRVLWEWLAADWEFAQQYARAKQWSIYCLAEEVIEIADDSSKDCHIDEKGRRVVNHAFIERARLRIKARMWHVARIAPRKYGEGLLDARHDKPVAPSVEIFFVSGRNLSR